MVVVLPSNVTFAEKHKHVNIKQVNVFKTKGRQKKENKSTNKTAGQDSGWIPAALRMVQERRGEFFFWLKPRILRAVMGIFTQTQLQIQNVISASDL